MALAGAIDAHAIRRNVAKATINWGFSAHDARSKLHRLYPRDSWIDPVLAFRPPAHILKPVDRRRPDGRRRMPVLNRGEPLPGERRMVNGRPARQSPQTASNADAGGRSRLPVSTNKLWARVQAT